MLIDAKDNFSGHESTPSKEKAAEEIVTKHEKIIREAIKNEELE